MNQTIKKRIEEINSGIVPEGYEKTSFGIFPCDWEKDKSLGDICEINPKTEALPNEFIYIDLESVVDGKLIQENVIENAKAPSRAQRVLQKNDIIYQMVRPYQKNNFIFIQDDGSFKYVASTGYAQLRSDNYVFLYQMVNSEYFCTQVLKKCTGTNYPAINSQDLAEVNCAYPKDEQEQSRIAEILMQWDKAIELQEKLIEAYQKSKKYYLNKMFPKKGSYVPEIRFPGFTAPWEQCKFESLAETRRGLTYNPSNISPHGIRVLRSSNINEDTFVLSDDDVFVCPDAVKIECVKPNDILITAANGSTRLVGKHAIIVGIRENEAVHGGFMLVASSSMPFFLNAAMSAPWYLKFINLFVAGGNGAIGNLNKNDLDNQLLFVPKNAEQEQIGEFFRNFDNLITLHQQKRDKLLKQRKAMQQYLLTGIVRV